MIAEIVGVGHCCQDNICVVEHYPSEDGSTHILSIDNSQGGGAVATALVAASRLGTSTALLANLGNDFVGDQILDGLCRERVSTDLICRVPGSSSTSIVMVSSKNGSRTKFPCRDQLSNLVFTPSAIDVFKHARVLHLDGTHYQNAVQAADIAKSMGITVSLDACSMQQDNEKNRALLRLCDIVITNESYPLRLTGKSEMGEALRGIALLGPKVVATTLGKNGCCFLADEQLQHIPAYVVTAVDTTGAGDVFHGAFLSEWLRNPTLHTCLQFATATAALKCLALGGRSGIPTRSMVEAFLNTQPPIIQ